MQLFILSCLLPFVLCHGHGGERDTESGKTGKLRMHGRIIMVKGGEWGRHEDEGEWRGWSKRNEDDNKPMHGKRWWDNGYPKEGERGMGKHHGRRTGSENEEMMNKEWSMEEGGYEKRGEWRKDGNRHGRGDSDEDGEERGEWRKDGNRHGRGDRDEDSEERGEWRKDGNRHGRGDRDKDGEERGEWRKDGNRHGRGDRDEDSEERGEWRKDGKHGHGRGDRDEVGEERSEWRKDGKHGHGRGDRDEDGEERGEWRKDGKHGHGRGDSDEDGEERGEWRKDGNRHGRGDRDEDGFRHGRDQERHGYRGENMRDYKMYSKWIHGGDSNEDEVKRAYFRFIGRFNMMKGGREMMDRDRRQGYGKNRQHGDWSDNEDKDYGEESMKDDINKYSSMMIEKKLKKGMKMLYKQDPNELGKLITLSFLKMCECEGDDAAKLLKEFVAKADHSEDAEEETKRPKLPEIPDFGSNTTAKVAFLQNLSEEQRKMLFGYDLVKNMCGAAKRYIVKSKEFYDQYFTGVDSMTSTTVKTP